MEKSLNILKIFGVCLVAPLFIVPLGVWFLGGQMKDVSMPHYWTSGTWKATKIDVWRTACGILGNLTVLAILIVYVVWRVSISQLPEGTRTSGPLISAVSPYLIGLALAQLPVTIFSMYVTILSLGASFDDSLDDGPKKLWQWIVGWILVTLGYVAFLFGSWRVPAVYNF